MSDTLSSPNPASSPHAPPAARELLHALGTAVLAVDPRLRLAEINSAGETLLSTSRERAVDRTLDRLLPGNPSLIECIHTALGRERRYTSLDLELALPAGRRRTEATQRVEKVVLQAALERAGGNRRQAAALAGLGRNTLARKAAALGLLSARMPQAQADHPSAKEGSRAKPEC